MITVAIFAAIGFLIFPVLAFEDILHIIQSRDVSALCVAVSASIFLASLGAGIGLIVAIFIRYLISMGCGLWTCGIN